MRACTTITLIARGSCGTCLAAWGIADEQLVAGVRPSSLDEPTGWTLWADKTLLF